MPNAWQVFQKYLGGKGLSSKDMGEMWKVTSVKTRFKTLVGAEQGTTAEIASRLSEQDPFLHIPPPSEPVRLSQSVAEPESKNLKCGDSLN